MVEQKVIWTCEVCKEVYIADEGICLCGGTISPVVYVRKDDLMDLLDELTYHKTPIRELRKLFGCSLTPEAEEKKDKKVKI